MPSAIANAVSVAVVVDLAAAVAVVVIVAAAAAAVAVVAVVVAAAVGFVVVVVGLFLLLICSTSVPGGNQVDGLPPASSTESGAQSSRQEADKFVILPLFLLLCLRKIKKFQRS